MQFSDEKITLFKGGNRKRLTLERQDIRLMYILFIERFLMEKQWYRYYTDYLNQTISYVGFWKKVSKFEEYGLIKTYKYKVGQNGTTVKILGLNKEGLRLLSNVIPENQSSLVHSPPKNLDHFFGTKEVILNSLIDVSIYEVYSTRGSQTTLYPKIIPDGVIKGKGKTLYVELDTGTETIKELKSKMLAYFQHLNKEMISDEAIVIALLDDSIPNRKRINDRRRRLRNIYQAIIYIPEFWRTWVDIYILPLNLSHLAARGFFLESLQTKELKISKLINTLIKVDKIRIVNYKEMDWHIKRLKDEFSLYFDKIVVHEDTGHTGFATVFLYVEPGSVRSHFTLKRIIEDRSFYSITVEIIYVVYNDRKSMNQDVNLFGAIDKVRYITMEDLTDDYLVNPFVYERDTRSKLKKIPNNQKWPNLIF